MAFWGKEMPYLCHSWLLYPGLKDILPEKSNIIMFQNQFQIVETDWDEREAEWRIWGKSTAKSECIFWRILRFRGLQRNI